jgi:hypothetical protein
LILGNKVYSIFGRNRHCNERLDHEDCRNDSLYNLLEPRNAKVAELADAADL